MKAADRIRYIDAVDKALLPLHFERPALDQAWRKLASSNNCLWVHLNFGLAIINPSLGVKYQDIGATLPSEAGGVTGTMRMLSSLTSRNYSDETPPSKLVEDLLTYGLPELEALQNRREVIRRLASPVPTEWPVAGSSSRMRLLPLLLAAEGHVEESLSWLSSFELLPDQLVPSYETFTRYFRSAHGA